MGGCACKLESAGGDKDTVINIGGSAALRAATGQADHKKKGASGLSSVMPESVRESGEGSSPLTINNNYN